MDSDAIFQLFDLKTTHTFVTQPGINSYNMPLYNTNGYPTQTEPGNQLISYYPVFQGFIAPCWVNGIQVPFYVDRSGFYNIWPFYVQALNNTFFGDGTTTSFKLNVSDAPCQPGYVDITGIIAAGSTIDPIVASQPNASVPKTSIYPNVYIATQDADNNQILVTDSGQFLNQAPASGNMQLGMLVGDVTGPYSSDASASPSNIINYTTGEIWVTFSTPPGNGVPINTQCLFFQSGLPRAVLFYNNCIQVMPPPDTQYQVQLNAYLSPAAFLSTPQAIQFAYMSEYIARGAARKILTDTGDVEQFQFYEPIFKEQRDLVWKRSQRIWTSQRTGTIFSEYSAQSPSNNYAGGGN